MKSVKEEEILRIGLEQSRRNKADRFLLKKDETRAGEVIKKK